MEEINDDVETVKSLTPRSATRQEGPRRFPRASVLSFRLLSVFPLAVLIGLTVCCHYSEDVAAAHLSAVKANLTERLQARDQLINQLNANLTEKSREVDRLLSLMDKGWRKFGSSFYLLSTEKASWEQSRDNCTARGADLVIVDSEEEKEFINSMIEEDIWIGLSDRKEEGTWKWVDGSPLNLTFWSLGQPDNGGRYPGEEDCVEIRIEYTKRWNDRSCEIDMYWICEKEA